jgi:von Willebrand factor type A domain
MIRLTCTHCKSTLEMDDAFAGGVCRCQHCGTIQTVPSHAKSTAYPQPATKSSSKSLYKGRTTTNLDSATSSSSGLDELASAVASSGLASELSKQPGGRVGGDANGAGRQSGSSSRSSSSRGNGSRGQTLAYRTPDAGAKKNNLVLILALAGGGVAVLLVVVLLAFLLMRGSAVSIAPAGGTGGASGGAVTSVSGSGGESGATSGPRFCDLPLTGQRVVYVLDRGDASKMLFDPLKNAAYKSVETLGDDREFAIVFWKRSTDSGLEDVSFPIKGTVRATKNELDACKKKFEDLTASGATEIDDAINAAMARNPDEIVIATPKGYLLEENVLAAVDRARGTSSVKIHTIGLGFGGSSNVLKAIAQKTGGTYREIPEKDLRAQ